VEAVSDDTSRAKDIAILTLAVAFLGTLVALCWEPVEPSPVVDDRKAVALAESLATARAEARHNLQEWKTALQDRDTVVRRVVKYIQRHDTAWRDHVADSGKMIDTVEVVRWLAVSDSTLRVVRDSLEGEVVQARFDADQCNEALAAKPSGYWRGFGQGVTVGIGLGFAGCGVVR
jgi:hypothetical protein